MMPLSDAALRGRRRVSYRVIVVAVVALVAFVYLIISGIRAAAVNSVTIAELQTMGPAAAGKGARVTGLLEGESISWDAGTGRLSFRIREGERSLPVIYQGTQPEMFRDGAEVIVEGRLGADGTFQATTLELKCPSKYESGAPAQGALPRKLC